MRGFFVLLLLTNIVLIGWQYVQSEGKQEAVDVYHDISVVNDGLTLLRELTPEQHPPLREDLAGAKATAEEAALAREGSQGANASAVSEKAGVNNTAEGSEVCMRVTGIDDRAQLEKLRELLRADGVDVTAQGESHIKRTSYWVTLPPYPNRAKADEAAAILGSKQIKDFFIVRSGEYMNAVSLGVFSTRERAERRYRQIVELKVRLRRPKIEAIDLPATTYFVSYKVSSQGLREKLRRDLAEIGYQSHEEIRCQ